MAHMNKSRLVAIGLFIHMLCFIPLFLLFAFFGEHWAVFEGHMEEGHYGMWTVCVNYNTAEESIKMSTPPPQNETTSRPGNISQPNEPNQHDNEGKCIDISEYKISVFFYAARVFFGLLCAVDVIVQFFIMPIWILRCENVLLCLQLSTLFFLSCCLVLFHFAKRDFDMDHKTTSRYGHSYFITLAMLALKLASAILTSVPPFYVTEVKNSLQIFIGHDGPNAGILESTEDGSERVFGSTATLATEAGAITARDWPTTERDRGTPQNSGTSKVPTSARTTGLPMAGPPTETPLLELSHWFPPRASTVHVDYTHPLVSAGTRRLERSVGDQGYGFTSTASLPPTAASSRLRNTEF